MTSTDVQPEIIDVCPRDGLQNESVTLSTADKVSLIERIAASGIRRIEATSFVNPKRVPTMADADALMASLNQLSNRAALSLIGLALNARGAERAAAAGCDEINYVLIASDTFSLKNQGVDAQQALAALAAIVPVVESAQARFSVSIGASFGCPFEGEINPERVIDLAAAAVEAGATEIGFADTIGCGVPRQVETLVNLYHRRGLKAALRMHFHNTRNTGIANALAAVECGVMALDASTGGFGGCPFAPNATGNIATEDLLYALQRSGQTDYSLTNTVATAQWLAEKIGRPAPSALANCAPFPPMK